jgi:hypothetical protein
MIAVPRSALAIASFGGSNRPGQAGQDNDYGTDVAVALWSASLKCRLIPGISSWSGGGEMRTLAEAEDHQRRQVRKFRWVLALGFVSEVAAASVMQDRQASCLCSCAPRRDQER